MATENRHQEEILTDNTSISYCEQCADCKHWGNSDNPHTNAYDKASCDKYPQCKPLWVINNELECDEFEWREG